MSKKQQRKLRDQQAQSPASIKEKKQPASGGGVMSKFLLLFFALVPFFLSGDILDPVLMPRYIFLAVFLLVFVVFIYFFKKKYIPVASLPLPVKIVFGLGLAFGLWSLVSMINSLNYREGYIDTFRHGLNLVLLYVVLSTIVQEGNQWMRVAKVLTVVAIIQSLIGISQYYDWGFGNIPGANQQPYGLMANRNFFGSAQVFIMPFVLYVFCAGEKIWRYVAGAALATLVLSIFLSQTRSAWLASIAMLLVSTVLVIIFIPAQRKKWLMGSAIALLAAAALIGLVLASDSGELKESIKERVTSVVGSSDSTSNAAENISERLNMWTQTSKMIKDHPIMGVGPGNWKLIMPLYITPEMTFAEGVFSPDRPHNVYLQVASETGIPGALLYFGMWIMIAVCGFRFLRQSGTMNDRLPVILMLSGLAAVASDAFLSFPIDRIEHSAYMILMAGIILGYYTKLVPQEQPRVSKIGLAILVPVVLLIAFNIFIGVKRYNFERSWKLVNSYNQERLFAESLDEASRGKNNIIVMDESGAPLELFTAFAYKSQKNYPAALREIKKANAYHPNNSRIYSEWGTIYTDLQNFDSAILLYKKALELTPRSEIPIKNLAANYYFLNNDSACYMELSKLNLEKEPRLQDMMRQVTESLTRKGRLK